MINHAKTSDSDLISRLKALAVEERKVVAQILDLLQEVDRRRLFADFGYPSLWEFCTRELGYSGGAAHRRIEAMRLARELPEIEASLINGTQSLSSLAQARKFFRVEEKHQKLSVDHKREVLSKIEGKSSRDCERILLQISSAPLEFSKMEKERALNETHTELKLVLDEELLAKLKRIQALRSHASPDQSYAELLKFMADEVLRRLDPELRVSQSMPTPEALPTSEVTPALNARGRRIAIPRALRDSIWKHAQGKCVWQHPETGLRCSSTRFLEIDHIEPVSLGGSNAPDNLRILCRAHNQRAALRVTGLRKP
jgi:hypothetical protein